MNFVGTLLNPRFRPIGLKSIMGLTLNYSWAPSWVKRDLVCDEFEGELLGVTRDKKGEDACKGESSDSGTLKRWNVQISWWFFLKDFSILYSAAWP